MLNVAFALAIVPVPSLVVPSLNVTVPVAAEGDIVAVKVTDEANVDGFVAKSRSVSCSPC